MTIATIRQSLHDSTVEELRRVIAACIGLVVALLLLYGYFVATTIFNMVQYRAASAETSRITAELGDLEAQYLALGNTLTLDRAHELGFVDAPHPAFVALGAPHRLTLASDLAR